MRVHPILSTWPAVELACIVKSSPAVQVLLEVRAWYVLVAPVEGVMVLV